MAGVHVAAVDYAEAAEALHAVREAVFVAGQGVPAALERDGADPGCLHVLARDAAGAPVGTARLMPPGAAGDDLPRIGRMAVLPAWRGRGVGDALLAALEALARERGWPCVALHAQAGAIAFYARNGYLPRGPRFVEAGIRHQAMRRRLSGPVAIETRDEAVAIVQALAHRARRQLVVHSRALDPGLFDAPEVLEALRRLAVRGGGIGIAFVLHDAATAQREHAPLLTLAQRLPSVFDLREIADPVDRGYPSAFVANDRGGGYFRPLGHRFDGEAALDADARARQLRDLFAQVRERSRPCTELRALGL